MSLCLSDQVTYFLFVCISEEIDEMQTEEERKYLAQTDHYKTMNGPGSRR